LADATEAVGAVQHAGERPAQLVIVFDDGNGDGHLLKGRSKNEEGRMKKQAR
jgi:hypothetical protein